MIKLLSKIKEIAFQDPRPELEMHLLREQYPELVGSSGITSTKKRNWQINDLIPLGLIIALFIALIWTFGYYKPAQRIVKLNQDIKTLNRVFDSRTKQVIKTAENLKVFITENELPESASAWLNKLQLDVSKLALEKPSEATIQKRFDAEAKFTALAKEITENRDLSDYGELEPLPVEFTDHDVQDRGRKTINKAEEWFDELTPIEVEAKTLMVDFFEKPMPKREGELKRVILNEWRGKHQTLLGHWKELKKQELAWREILEKRQELKRVDTERQAKIDNDRTELKKKIAENQKAIDAERSRLRSQRKKVTPQKKKPKKKVSQRPTNKLEQLKRKASRLLD